MTLLERERELEAIEGVLDRGGVLILEGGAGIGKTSLVNTACERGTAAGQEVLRGRGSELESGFEFGVVLQLFERRVAAAEHSEANELFAGPAAAARPLFTGETVAVADAEVSFAVLHGLYWLAVNLAARRPLVMAVDDAHWVDGPSLRWLAYLAPRLGGLPVALILALRPAGAASEQPSLLVLHEQAAVVRPGLLSENATSEIVRSVIGGAADELCAAAWRESGGNPFYLRELLRAGDLTAVAHPSGGLSRLVAARIRGLDPRALRLGQALAVLGDGCELRHAASIAEMDVETASRLAYGLVRLEVLAGDAPPRFLHPVLREVLEWSLAGDPRSSAHRAAAGLLGADGAAPGLVAAHLMRVRPAGEPWVVERLRDAAGAALGSGAPQAAADLLKRALAEPPLRAERVSVLREGAAAESMAGRKAACALLEEALGLEADPHRRAEIALQLAEAHANLYQWADAVDVCERALAELDQDASPLASRLQAEVGVCGLRDARLVARALPALDRLAGRPLEGTVAEAYAIGRAMADHMIRGRSAREIARPLLVALEHAGPRAESWDLRLPGLVTLLWTEAFDEVEGMLQAMLTEVRRSGSARGLHVTYASLGLLNLLLGALPEADAAARVALRVLREAEFSRGLPLVASVLSGVAIQAGQLEEAEALLETVPLENLPPSLPALLVSVTKAQLRLAQGRPADALREFETCRAAYSAEVWGREMHDNGFLHIRSGSAQALLLLGAPERALELAEAELSDARDFGAPRALGRALRVAGLVRGREEGLAALDESVSVLRASPALLERGYSLVELGSALRRLGRRTAAREPLAEALELAARCGAPPLAARAREELKATGARPRRDWRTGVEALTPSELRVARLALEGHSNREIAQLLYLTVKTIESHLAHVYDKLEIAGRAELASGLSREKIRVPTP